MRRQTSTRACGQQSVVSLAALGFLATGIAAWVAPPSARGQNLQNRIINAPPFMQAPRPVTRLLNEGVDGIREKRYADAISALYALLTDDAEELPVVFRGQDFFTPESLVAQQSQLYNDSVRGRADKILATLPSDAREILAVQYGVTARQKLSEAVSQHDQVAIAWVARNFPHTESSYDALALIARQRLLEGSPIAAALTFRRLLEYPVARDRFGPSLLKAATATLRQASRIDAAVELMSLYSPLFPGGSIDLDGRQISLGSPDDWREILENSVELSGATSVDYVASDWTTVGGNAERNAVAKTGMPIPSVRWAKNIHANVLEKNAIESYERNKAREGSLLLPKFSLRMTNNYVISKTTDDTILAIDFETGNIKWLMSNAVADLRSSSGQRAAIASPDEPPENIRSRVWDSDSFGHFSTDRERIFAVREKDRGVQRTAFSRSSAPSRNYLAAYSIENEGGFLWTAGNAPAYGLPSASLVPDALRDAFFMGPPLPVDGQLYCLLEARGQIMLAVFDAASGELAWQQQLANAPQRQFGMGSQRDNQLLTPTFTEGLIVCPTGVGAIVAIDQVTRDIRWSYMYGGASAGAPTTSGFMRRPRLAQSQDSRVIAGEGFVAVSPSNVGSLLCLDVLDGEPKRKPVRDELLGYPISIRNGEILVAGKRRLRWFSVDSDQKREGPVYPDGKLLAGRCVNLGDELLLPLSERTVARIDGKSGKLLESVDVSRPVGNLFAYKNNLLSVNETEIVAYFTRDGLKDTLGETQQLSAALLNRRSLLSLADDKPLDAIMLLEQALELEPGGVESQYLMAEALMQGLKSDYARYRELAVKYEDVVPDRLLKSQLMQMLALGDIDMGEYSAAFKRLLELLRNQPADEFSPTKAVGETISLSDRHSVDGDAWIASTLARAFEKSNASEKVELGRLVTERANDIRSRVVSFRRRQLAYFAWLPPAHPFILELAEDLQQLRDYTAAETLLQPVLLSGTRENVTAAKRLLAVLPPTEVQYLGVLGRRGRSLVQSQDLSLPQLEKLGFPDAAKWKSGRLEFGTGGTQHYQPGRLVPQVTQRWGRPPIPITLEGKRVSIYNGLGEVVTTMGYPRSTANGEPDQLLVRSTLRGGLLILETVAEVAAFDIQRGLHARPDDLLWRKSLTTNSATARSIEPTVRADEPRLGFWVAHRQIGGGNSSGVGPLTASGIPIQIGERVSMQSALTGETLWSRVGYREQLQFLSNGSELAILEQTELGQCAVEILDARDGSELRKYIRATDRVPWFSCGPLSVDTQQRYDAPDNGIESPYKLEVWNPFTDETMLSLPLGVGARCEKYASHYVAIVEPDGKLHYIDLERLAENKPAPKKPAPTKPAPTKEVPDGEAVTPTGYADLDGYSVFDVPVSSGLDSIAVEQFGTRMLVISNSRGEGPTLRANELYTPDEPVGSFIPVNGHIYAIDTTSGQLAWPSSGEVYNMLLPRKQPRESIYMALFRPKDSKAELAMIRLTDGSIASHQQVVAKSNIHSFSMTLAPLQQAFYVELETEKLEFTATDDLVAPQPVVYLRTNK